MKRRWVRTLITSVVVSSLMFANVSAAPSVDELKNKKAAAESEVNDLQQKLNILMAQINDLENQLISTGEQLMQAEEDLAAAEEKKQQQYEEMKLRIKYMYEESDSSVIDRVVSSKSMAEALNQVEYIQKVHNYDRDMLREYENTVKEVEDIKAGLEQRKTELEGLQVQYEAQSEELNTTIEEKSGEIENLDEMIQEAVRKALEEERRRQEEERKRQEEARKQQEAAAQQAAAQQAQAGTQQSAGDSGANSTNSTDSKDSGGSSNSAPAYNAATGNTVVDRAYKSIGKPYVWAATGPNAFDCSGLVGYCLTGSYGRIGTAASFLGWPRVSDPQPGDIAVKAGHCGIYIGGGQMIHAPQPGESVKVGPVQSGMVYVRR